MAYTPFPAVPRGDDDGGGGGGGVALGETSSTAYRGDRGKTAYDHSQVVTGNPHGTAIGDISGLQTAIDAKAPLASPTFTGTPAAPTPTAADSSTKVATTAFVAGELGGKLSATGGGKDSTSDLGSMTGTVTVDLSLGNSFYGVLSGNVTSWTLSNATSGKECQAVIEITQHASAAKTVVYPSAWKWAGGVDHVMSTAVGAKDVIVLRTRDGGTTIDAAIFGQAFA